MQCIQSFGPTRLPVANVSMFAKATPREFLDVSDRESQELLDLLFAQVTKPQYVYRHKWRVGDLLMWDNCAVQHLASFDYALPLRRLMERVIVEGSVPY
jgi:taurine dioxygenase